MNVRYDETVHAGTGNPYGGPAPSPLCGDAMMPACAPEETDDAVNCWECKSLTD